MATAEKSIAPTKNELVNGIMAKVTALQGRKALALPPNYSAQNALMSAYLKLQQLTDKEGRPVLQVCAQESIANSLLDMVIQGLNPAKNQCYFIAYGKALTLQRSYFGTASVAMRVTKAPRLPFAACIYEGDEFEYEIVDGNKRIVKHVQKFQNVNKDKITGAYATVYMADGSMTEIMTIDQIKQAWMQSLQKPFDEKGNLRPGTVHAKFTDEMAKKTVLSRACKMAINTSDDSTLDLVVESVNRTDDAADEAAFEEEVATHANGQVLDAEWAERVEPSEELAQQSPEAIQPDVQGNDIGRAPEPTRQAQKASPKPVRKDRGF